MPSNVSTAPTAAVLAVSGLAKRYAATVAVDGVSFEVRRNEIVGLLGPNGAGKTTTLNMIMGVLEPSAGSIAIEGIDLAKDRAGALARTNFAGRSTRRCRAISPCGRTSRGSASFTMCAIFASASRRCSRSSISSISSTRNAACSRRASRRASRLRRRCSTSRRCCCSTSRPRRSTRRPRRSFARSSAASPSAATAEFSGPRTTCTKSRMSAIACCSCRAGRFCSKAIRARCRANMAPVRSRSCSSSSPASRCTRGEHR